MRTSSLRAVCSKFIGFVLKINAKRIVKYLIKEIIFGIHAFLNSNL